MSSTSHRMVTTNRRRFLVGSAGIAAAAALGTWQVRSADAATLPLYQRCSFGAHADNEPYPDLSAHYGLESITGAKLPRMSWFMDMGAPWNSSQAASAANSAHALCIAWSPVFDGRWVTFAELLTGKFDYRLRAFFAAAAKHPRTVTIRPFWEMNCSSARESVVYTGSQKLCTSTAQYKQLWQHLVHQAQKVGATNIRWFFNPNGTDVGGIPMEQYWPGSSYVDEMGFNTYNDNWSPWKDFDLKVAPMYNRLAALDPRIPISIGEIGCKEDGAPPGESKATWSRKMFESTSFPRLKHIDFYNRLQSIDWRIQSSYASLAVYQKYLPLAKSGLVSWT